MGLVTWGRWMAGSVILAVALGMGPGAIGAEVDANAVRARVLLAAEPAGAVSIATAKSTLGPTPKPIVVVGRIGGKGTSPFGKKEATFSLVDLPADDHASKPGHNADDCPFCKKRAANAAMAAVSVAGDDGVVIPVDARTLLSLVEGQDVVVQGTGFFDAKLGIPVIQIRASGIFVRKGS